MVELRLDGKLYIAQCQLGSASASMTLQRISCYTADDGWMFYILKTEQLVTPLMLFNL